MLADQSGIVVPRLLVGCRWRMWVNSKNLVSTEAWVNMNMQVGHFLECCLADRVPKTDPFMRKRRCNRASNPRKCRHKRSADRRLELSHVGNMVAGNNQCMAGMELPKIYKCHGKVILKHNAGRQPA